MSEIQIVRPHKQEAPYACSACGADRGCDCNAPAIEKLAKITEQRRQARRAYREREREEGYPAPLDNIVEFPDVGTGPPVDRHQELIDALLHSVSQMRREMRKAQGKDPTVPFRLHESAVNGAGPPSHPYRPANPWFWSTPGFSPIRDYQPLEFHFPDFFREIFSEKRNA